MSYLRYVHVPLCTPSPVGCALTHTHTQTFQHMPHTPSWARGRPGSFYMTGCSQWKNHDWHYFSQWNRGLRAILSICLLHVMSPSTRHLLSVLKEKRKYPCCCDTLPGQHIFRAKQRVHNGEFPNCLNNKGVQTHCQALEFQLRAPMGGKHGRTEQEHY